jgi:large conductance mechanosensitive channel
MGNVMGMLQEFKEFAMKGNVVDLAVGVIIGAAFAPIVGSLVADIIMPVIGYAVGNVDFSNLFFTLKGAPVATLKAAKEAGNVTINYGQFVTYVINFLITAAAIFMLVKAMNKMKKPVPGAPPPAPPASETYLKEIRDALVKR